MAEQSVEVSESGEADAPLALLYCTDLMFAVQLQNMARKAGFRFWTVRPDAAMPPAAVMIVDLASRGDWEAAILRAREQGTPVLAFGPHMDATARLQAKKAGASRVIANSNLARDMPAALRAFR
ncbi:MAG: hypothetical protein IVW55_09975 [Chloroflexi bacterium]|nr:hypothetical protein [Chloroflexota bacterium]